MKGLRPNLIRAETVRLIDMVLESLADGRLDRVTLRKLPPWRAVVLARIARRVGAMPQHELDDLTEEAIRVGVDGKLAEAEVPELLPAPPGLKLVPAGHLVSKDAPEWTQGGMVKKSRTRRHTGSRRPSC